MFDIFTQNEYTKALFVILLSLFIVVIFRIILKVYSIKVSHKTRTDIDDIMIGAIRSPLSVLILIAGLYSATKLLPYHNQYNVWADRIFFVTCVLLFSTILSRITNVFIGKWLGKAKKFEKTPKLIGKVISIAIYTIGIFVALEYFDIQLTPILATLGLGGLAVGLALKDTLSNFFAGLHIVSDRPINIGDFIELPGEKLSGKVKDIGWRSTRLKTLDENIVIVPNAKLAESTIINDSLSQKKMKIYIECGVAYDSDLEKVEKVVTAVIKELQRGMKEIDNDEKPIVRFHTFGDSNIDFRAIIMVGEYGDRFIVRHEFIKALKARFDKESIEISWPERKVHMIKD